MSSSQPPSSWYALPAEDCLQRLDSSLAGLSAAKAAERLERVGLNRLELKAGRSKLRILWDQFSNVMLIMLLAVAAVSAWVAWVGQKFPKDAIAIVLIVVLNALLGYLQESRAQDALLALRQMAQPLVTVRRDDEWQRLASEQLVPGDLIRLEAGDRVPADGRLLEVAELGLREAALTGEAEAVFKQAQLVLEPGTPVLERQNSVFQGTEVVRGRGTAVVTATGMATELGQIAELINTAGGEDTPLQKRLDGLANVLVFSSLALVAVVVVIGVLMGQELLNLLEVALSMAVAIVPEGLPAVITVTLAIGTQRMVQRAALIRRLPAVEALGSVTVICSDKTGTLTQNRQVVQELRSGTGAIAVSGHGYQPTGQFSQRALTAPVGAREGVASGAQQLLLQAGVLCSDAELKRLDDGGWDVLGDPTEGALVVAAAKAQIDAFALRSHNDRLAEIPFSSERQLMAVWVGDPTGSLQAPLGAAAEGSHTLMISKGAPEVILGLCNRWLDGGGMAPLEDSERSWWLEQARELAASGLRVLAFACAPHHLSPDHGLEGLVLLGLMAQLDPARPEVPEAVARCRRAGIRPVMITGDHPLTARAIGTGIGLVDPGAEVVLGRELEQLDDAALQELVGHCSIYARVPPDQKLRIVKALQARNEIVAMTGDGVNDAPALKAADIGVTMGRRGTAVAREAADLVLLDDTFAALVAALALGRRIDSNLHRALGYTLAIHLPIAALGLLPLLVPGQPLLLLPVHIALLHLVIDPACTLVFEALPGDPALMRMPPRPPQAPLFAPLLWRRAVIQGMAVMVVAAGLLSWSSRPGLAAPADSVAIQRTVVFALLLLSSGGLVWLNAARRNVLTLAGAGIGLGLWLLTLSLPGLQRLLGLVPLPASLTLLVLLASALSLVLAAAAPHGLGQGRQGG